MPLSLIIFLPAIGAVLIALVGRSNPQRAKWLALTTALLTFLLSLPLYLNYQNNPEMQFEEQVTWIQSLGVS